MISFKALYVKRNDNGIFDMLQTRPKIYQDDELYKRKHCEKYRLNIDKN